MRRALILDGGRFFGKKLVGLPIEEGLLVTIATRGATPDPFGEKVSRLVLDRPEILDTA